MKGTRGLYITPDPFSTPNTESYIHYSENKFCNWMLRYYLKTSDVQKENVLSGEENYRCLLLEKWCKMIFKTK